jgi:hypothetical protein
MGMEIDGSEQNDNEHEHECCEEKLKHDETNPAIKKHSTIIKLFMKMMILKKNNNNLNV